MSTYTYVDLFAGIGGFRLALDALGLRCVWSCETDANARKVYEANHGDCPAGDITEIAAADIPPHDLLCAGFPCQPFSVAASRYKVRQGFRDPKGQLFFSILRVARHHKPSVLLLENVPRILTMERGTVWNTMLECLRQDGYSHTQWAVLNASLFGIPQARKRLYAVAIHDSCVATWEEPKPRPYGEDKPVRLADVLQTPEEIGQDEYRRLIVNHPRLQLREGVDETPRNEPIRIGEIARADGQPKAPQSNTVHSDQGHAVTQCVAKGMKRGSGGIYHTKQGGDGIQGYRVYSPEGHAVTQSSQGGGYGANTGLYLAPSGEKSPKVGHGQTGMYLTRGSVPQSCRVHSPEGHATVQQACKGHRAASGVYRTIDGVVRTLSVRETARVMGFPDTFDFCGLSQTACRRLLGNAVIPKMIRRVFTGIRWGEEWFTTANWSVPSRVLHR